MTENVVPVADTLGLQADLADDAYSLPSRYYVCLLYTSDAADE